MNLSGIISVLVLMNTSGLQYVGAYRNLFPEMKLDQKKEDIRELQGRTKLQGSQVIDAQSLLELIGNKTTTEGGYIVINDNNLVLVLEQIQELSNLGEHEMAESLKTLCQ